MSKTMTLLSRYHSHYQKLLGAGVHGVNGANGPPLVPESRLNVKQRILAGKQENDNVLAVRPVRLFALLGVCLLMTWD